MSPSSAPPPNRTEENFHVPNRPTSKAQALVAADKWGRRPGQVTGRRLSPPLELTAQAEQTTAPAGTSVNGGQQQGSANLAWANWKWWDPITPAPGPAPRCCPMQSLSGAVGNRSKWGSSITPSKPSTMHRALVSSVMDELVAGCRAQRERLEARTVSGNEYFD